MIKLEPLKMIPIMRDYLWGGRKLSERLGKTIETGQTAAESWEIVDRDDAQSVVADGPWKGQTLRQLIADQQREMLGECDSKSQFPLLLKYLDCQRVLSVQVHPTDEYALKMPQPDLGKTEAWYIVDAEPDSVIYAGLKDGVDRLMLAEAIQDQQTEKVLHEIRPNAGDCIFIPAGTVHALGAGLLVAEIQQASDTTFRLYDWNRVGTDGKPRPLHIEQALAVTNYDSGPVYPVSPKDVADGWQQLVDCDKFQLLKASECGSYPIPSADRFVILSVPCGKAILRWAGGTRSLEVGDSVLVPAAVTDVEVVIEEPHSTVLRMHGPADTPCLA